MTEDNLHKADSSQFPPKWSGSAKVDLLGEGFGLGVAVESFEQEVNSANSKS